MQTVISVQQVAVGIFVFVAVLAIVSSSPLSNLNEPRGLQNRSSESCSAEQLVVMPCRCCKMGCWYAVAKSATHELGHVPGQAGEDEALATLKLIRACMITECSEVCTVSAPRNPPPFFLAAAARAQAEAAAEQQEA
uniref:Secreted protein n=1 Tax=Panagrellus redivivus TaxID=6233 RepID=A0A7E4ZTM4_PANRE